MHNYCAIIVSFLYVGIIITMNDITDNNTKLLNIIKNIKLLPRELHRKCSPDLYYLMPDKKHKKEWYFREYYAIAITELVILSAQCLKEGISLTHKERPLLAFMVYKNMHKDHEQFLFITNGLFSPEKDAQPFLGWPLLKVLGPTIFEKMRMHISAQQLLVEDFKEVLCMESSQFLFPHTQYGFEECPTLLNKQKQYREQYQKQEHRRSSLNPFFYWNDSKIMACEQPEQNVYLFIKSELILNYSPQRDCLLSWSENVCANTYFCGNTKQFIMSIGYGEDSLIPLHFIAVYDIQDLSLKDQMIHALLKVYSTKIKAPPASTFYDVVSQKADAGSTQSAIASLKYYTTPRYGSLIDACWHTVTSFGKKMWQAYWGTQKGGTAELEQTAVQALPLERVHLGTTDNIAICPHFWSTYDRSLQKDTKREEGQYRKWYVDYNLRTLPIDQTTNRWENNEIIL